MDKQPLLNSAENISNFVIFKIDKSKVNIDVKFEEKELDEKVVCRDFRHTTSYGAIEGRTQDKEYISDFDKLLLDMDIK